MITITRPGQKDRTSKNLRGIYIQSREARVQWAKVKKPAVVEIMWCGGAHCITEFADYSVLCDWLNKARMFEGVTIAYPYKKGD